MLIAMQRPPPSTALFEPALQPRRLSQILWATSIACAVALLVTLFTREWASSLLLLTAIAILMLAIGLTQRGRVVQAAHIMLLTLTVSISGLVFLSQGIRDEAVFAYPGILIFASMFGTRRLYLGLVAVVFLVLSGVVAANLLGWHVNAVQPTHWGLLANILVILAVTAFFVWLMASDLRSALTQLQADNQRILESHARIDVLAHQDSLTGLPNRVLAKDRLEQAMALARRNQSAAAVLFLDLDNFKTVNDSMGHSAGDLLLCAVAQRLVAAVRDSDTVSRQGGDEFLIILGGLTDNEAATTAAVKIIDQLSTPFDIAGVEVSTTCSLGIAMFPKDGVEVDSLLKHADLAMYRAKDAGRNAFRFFDAEMNNSVIEHLQLTTGIRQALRNNEFKLYYQPQFALSTGRIVGAEALIRWRHDSLGFIPPDKFIPVAEHSGLIHELGAWVLNEACSQAKHWQSVGLGDLVIAVNVSPVQFRRDDIEREVATALADSGLAPSCIELELTESLLLADSEHLSGVLKRLRGMGIQFSIDDFGTGYSNLGYLSRFDVERLKIDQSFVRRMLENPSDEGIVRAIIEMAHCLKLQVVAEGIEDAPTLERLTALGCEFGQGYHWSPALPADDFAQYCRNYTAGAA
jgi:diguanylate cyclase (GGDEF)-like protein